MGSLCFPLSFHKTDCFLAFLRVGTEEKKMLAVQNDRHIYKTRRGDVKSSLREHYLRKDIYCQSAKCRVCPHNQAGMGTGTELSGDDDVTHYLIPDADYAEFFTDLLECDSISNVILLQTVVDSVSSAKKVDRLRKMSKVVAKHCVVVSNEFSQDMYVLRKAGESAEHRNARAVVEAAKWYTTHTGVPVVVLSEPGSPVSSVYSECRSVLPTSVSVVSGREYIAKNHSKEAATLGPLYDTLLGIYQEAVSTASTTGTQRGSSGGCGGGAHGSAFLTKYCAYVSGAELEDGLYKGRYFRGKLSVDQHATTIGSVRLSHPTESVSRVVVSGRANMNRAIHEDIVAVEVLPREAWDDPASTAPYGRVVAVMQHGWRPYVATIEADDDNYGSDGGSGVSKKRSNDSESSWGPMRSVLVVPYEVRVPKIRIRTRQAGAFGASRLVVVIDGWTADSAYPSGHIVRVLGEIGRVEAEVAAVLVENSIVCPPFTAALYDTLPLNTPQHPWRVPPAELEQRRDLRGERIYSIDPPGCRDIDDALSVTPGAGGTWTVGVHIADPTYFATEGSLLDKEARMRSTTVYLPHRRFPMVPPALSEDLCSLHEGCERLAFSVVYTFDNDCNVVDEWFGKTVVRSIHAMSYQQAHDVLHGLVTPSTASFTDRSQLQSELRVLLRISQKLKRGRAARGAVELFSEEVGFDFGGSVPTSSNSNNNGDATDARLFESPLGFSLHEELEVNSLVEEFMILANESVARRIYKAYPTTALLRRHLPPAQNQFERLLRCARSVGVELDTSSNKALARSLGAVAAPGMRNILMMLATRAMTEAEYFCTGAHDASEFYHYGLGSDFYTHFTSPIRRYSDMVVHRLLYSALLGNAAPPVTSKELEAIAEHMNMRNHGAKHAQKDAMLLFQVFYFKDKDVTADAIVYTVRDSMLLVHIPQYAVLGKVYLTNAEGKSLVPDPADPQTFVPASNISVDTDKETVTITAGNGATCVLHNFDTVKVHIGVTISRSHKPGLVLDLVSFPSSFGGKPVKGSKKKQQQKKKKQQQQQSQMNAKKEIVESVLASEEEKNEEEKEEEEKENSDGGGDDGSAYSFLQSMNEFMEKYFASESGGGGASAAADATATASVKEGMAQVIRRWCPTEEQVKKLEDERTQELKGPWADYLQQQGGIGIRETVETKYKSTIQHAESQVKEAERARIKQRKQFKK